MLRRDLLLQEMNIPQWILRKPHLLKGEAAISLSSNIKLIIISPSNYEKTPFFHDIMRALQLDKSQIQWLNIEQALRLTLSHQPTFWLIDDLTQADKISQKFTHLTIWLSEQWYDLQQSTQKRQLWQQFQHFLTEPN